MVAVAEQSSPLAATNCGVDPDRFALLSNTEPAQVLPSCEEIFEPPVIVHDAIDDTSARAHDLGRQQNDCL
jgi:hypothetical protein